MPFKKSSFGDVYLGKEENQTQQQPIQQLPIQPYVEYERKGELQQRLDEASASSGLEKTIGSEEKRGRGFRNFLIILSTIGIFGVGGNYLHNLINDAGNNAERRNHSISQQQTTRAQQTALMQEAEQERKQQELEELLNPDVEKEIILEVKGKGKLPPLSLYKGDEEHNKAVIEIIRKAYDGDYRNMIVDEINPSTFVCFKNSREENLDIFPLTKVGEVRYNSGNLIFISHGDKYIYRDRFALIREVAGEYAVGGYKPIGQPNEDISNVIDSLDIQVGDTLSLIVLKAPPKQIVQQQELPLEKQSQAQQTGEPYEPPVAEPPAVFQHNQNQNNQNRRGGGMRENFDESVDWNYWNYWDFESGEWKKLKDIAVKLNRQPYIDTFTHATEPPWFPQIDYFLILDISVRTLKETKTINFINDFRLVDDSGKESGTHSVLITGTSYAGYDMYEKLNPGKMRMRRPDIYGAYSDEVSAGAAEGGAISRRLPFYAGESQRFGPSQSQPGKVVLPPQPGLKPGSIFEPYLKGVIFLHYRNSSTQVANLDWQRGYAPDPPRQNQSNTEINGDAGINEGGSLEDRIKGRWRSVSFEGDFGSGGQDINYLRFEFSESPIIEINFKDGKKYEDRTNYAVKDGKIIYSSNSSFMAHFDDGTLVLESTTSNQKIFLKRE